MTVSLGGERPTQQADRRNRMREYVVRNGYATNEELAEAFSVSLMTVHRDLELLSDESWIVKVRGGARAHPAALLDTTVRSRSERMLAEKKAIANQALTHVERGNIVLFDESTTGLAMADGIVNLAPLTVITNFQSLMTRLGNQTGIDLISLGGTYDPAYDAFFGILASETAAKLHADVLFMSTTAIQDGICCHKSQETVHLKQALLDSAAKKVLLADHSKFNQRALHRLTPVGDFDVIIVDSGIDPAVLENLRKANPNVEVAQVG